VKTQPDQRFIPLELETRPTVDTAAYAHYMHIAQQTARIHACKETGPIRPIRVPGTSKLHWPVAEIRRVLGVAPRQNGFINLAFLVGMATLAMLAQVVLMMFPGILASIDFAGAAMLGGLMTANLDDAGVCTFDSLAASIIDSKIENSFDDICVDTHRNAPRPDSACLYGLVGDVAHVGSDNTEANPFAIAAAMLAYLGTAVGRGPFMPIGDDWNHSRLFMVHVGRSSRGRKGTAKKLVYRIHNAVKAIDEFLAPQVHRGGLSTREGLALMIHDGYVDGKNEVPAIEDKRLLVVESEFSNILHQSKRDGNTLSAALRDAWDGTSIRPAVKTCRVWATDPHVGIIGDVTPSELRDLMHRRELTNGFANRFIFFWAEGDKVLPFPQYTPNHVVDTLAERVANVLRFAGADRYVEKDVMRMEFSPEGKALYSHLYKGELRDRSAGEHITGLLDRRAPVLLRLAMLFALTDQTNVIAVEHINAAMAWVRYWVDSVKFIFQSAMDEVGAAQVSSTAQKIVTFLTEREQATRTELSKTCLGGHVSKDKLDRALDELITASPPAIEVASVARHNGQPGSPSKVYKLYVGGSSLVGVKSRANSANPAQCEPPGWLMTDLDPMRNARNQRSEVEVTAADLRESAHFADSADAPNQGLTDVDVDTSLISQSPHCVSVEVINLDEDVEVF